MGADMWGKVAVDFPLPYVRRILCGRHAGSVAI